MKKSVTLIEDDYEHAIPYILSTMGGCFGLIYIDPNGVVNMDALEQTSKHRCNGVIDILFNYNATAYKRNRCVNDLDELLPMFKKIKKNYWYVSEPKGKWQWSLFYGANKQCIKLPKSLGFHEVHTSQGQRILHTLNYTKEEYKLHLPNQPKISDFINENNAKPFSCR